MKEPLFTVLMPAYNTAPYIASAMLSVCNQNYRNWELLVVMDPESDGETYYEATLLKNSVNQGHKIRIIESPKHGLQFVTNYGIAQASADIIGVLDSDDQIYEDAITSSVAEQARSKKVGFTWSLVMMDTGKLRGGPVEQYTDLYSAFMDSGWWKAQHFRTFKRSWYLQSRGLRLHYEYAVDYNLAICMAESGCECVYIPRALYWYRSRRPTNMSNSKRRKQRWCFDELRFKWRKLHEGDRRKIKRETNKQKKAIKRNIRAEKIKRAKRVVPPVRREPVVVKRSSGVAAL